MNSTAYLMGWDCGKNGANATNCHYSLFSTPELTAEWERGRADAEAGGDLTRNATGATGPAVQSRTSQEEPDKGSQGGK